MSASASVNAQGAAAAGNLSQPAPSRSERVDLYSSWKIVFEHARAVEMSESHERVRLGVEDSPSQAAAQTGIARESAFDAVPAELQRAADRALDPQRVLGRDHLRATVAAPGRDDLSATAPPINPSSVDTVGNKTYTLAQRVLLSDTRWIESERSSRPEIPPSSIFEAEPAPESVRVFQRGDSVAVIVRDATLSEADALRSAFEVARELTGKSSALNELIFNGHTLYRQQRFHPDQSDAADAVTFTC